MKPATPPRWEQSTKEVLFYVCEHCCLRLDADMGPQGTESALPYLFMLYAEHMRQHHWRERIRWYNGRDWRQHVRVQVIELFAPLDLSDILSERALERRATAARSRARLTMEEARARVESHIRTVTARQGRYVCRQCGRPITRKRAQLDGIGVYCRARNQLQPR